MHENVTVYVFHCKWNFGCWSLHKHKYVWRWRESHSHYSPCIYDLRQMSSSLVINLSLFFPLADSWHWEHEDRCKTIHCGRFPQCVRQDQPGHAETHAAALQGDVRWGWHRLDEVWLSGASAGHQPGGWFLRSSSWWVDLSFWSWL